MWPAFAHLLQVLLRALRDFNLGKLTHDDSIVFLGLLADLFPKTSNVVARAVDHVFESTVRKAEHEPMYDGAMSARPVYNLQSLSLPPAYIGDSSCPCHWPKAGTRLQPQGQPVEGDTAGSVVCLSPRSCWLRQVINLEDVISNPKSDW